MSPRSTFIHRKLNIFHLVQYRVVFTRLLIRFCQDQITPHYMRRRPLDITPKTLTPREVIKKIEIKWQAKTGLSPPFVKGIQHSLLLSRMVRGRKQPIHMAWVYADYRATDVLDVLTILRDFLQHPSLNQLLPGFPHRYLSFQS